MRLRHSAADGAVSNRSTVASAGSWVARLIVAGKSSMPYSTFRYSMPSTIGTIVNVTDRRITLKLGDSVRVECLRSAVTGLESDNRADADSA